MYSQRMQVRFRDVERLMFRQIYPNSIIFVWRPSKWHTFIQLILKSPGHRNWGYFLFYLKNVINGRIAWQWLIKWSIIIKMEKCLPWLLSWSHIWNIKFETSYKEWLVLNYHAIVQSCTERKSLIYVVMTFILNMLKDEILCESVNPLFLEANFA